MYSNTYIIPVLRIHGRQYNSESTFFECLPHTHAHNLNAHGTGEAWNRGYILVVRICQTSKVRTKADTAMNSDETSHPRGRSRERRPAESDEQRDARLRPSTVEGGPPSLLECQ